jgi:hypothetical protein|tara:strand:- start:669 stop:917 length:249 start_codon:yes stop_codon:yes gene_type:complete
MTEPLPRWIMKRYSLLWNKFKDKEFTHKKSSKILKEKDKRVVSLFLSDLKKYGWLEVRLNPQDSRIRLYKLKSPENAVKEIK